MKDYQNIFNRDFYPTPEQVISRMLSFNEISGKIILEPSFGSGNIVRYLQSHGAKEVLGCEINDKLRSAAECRVLCADFFSLMAEQVSHIDLIVMNPPFSTCERHILHAWEIAPPGCEIISLCNHNLVSRSWGGSKNIMELVNLHGFSENLGDVFSEAERRTDCEIGLIHLTKNGENGEEFSKYFSDEEDDEETGNGLIRYSEVREAVQRYVQAVSMFDSVMEANREINSVTSVFGFDAIKFGAYETGYQKIGNLITKDVFRKELQKKAWKWVFSKFNMERFLTQSVMGELNRVIELQSSLPFTMRNIYRMIEIIVGTHGDRMNHVICDAFDMITKYSNDNVTYHGEKWKTNSAHMVNRKFIVPYGCNVDWGGKVGIDYRTNTTVTDIVKALCYLTSTKYEWRDENGNARRIPDLYMFNRDANMEFGVWYQYSFFRIKCFKKGTIHFEFLDENVWYQFNKVVAEIRGWQLPVNVKANKKK